MRRIGIGAILVVLLLVWVAYWLFIQPALQVCVREYQDRP